VDLWLCRVVVRFSLCVTTQQLCPLLCLGVAQSQTWAGSHLAPSLGVGEEGAVVGRVSSAVVAQAWPLGPHPWAEGGAQWLGLWAQGH
jgi:hypothetical protein